MKKKLSSNKVLKLHIYLLMWIYVLLYKRSNIFVLLCIELHLKAIKVTKRKDNIICDDYEKDLATQNQESVLSKYVKRIA